MKLINDIPIEIRDNDVFKLLGFVKERDRELNDRFLTLFRDEKCRARGLIRPRAMFVVKDINSVPEREIFSGAKKVVFSLVTIGLKLEEKVSKLSASSKLERSVVLDAIGSAAVESVAAFVNEMVNKRAEKLSFDHTYRYSPGYCTWDISDQQLFFDLIPAAQIGVKLTQSLMMVPRKSITFAVNFGYKNEMDMGLGQRNCTTCGKVDCKYKIQRMVKDNKLVNGKFGG
jgi:hypothetical protein